MKKVKVQIKRLPHALDLELPKCGSDKSAGADLMAAIESDRTIYPGAVMTIPCGVSIALPDGHEAQVRPRSGLAAKHGIGILNSPGTVDADYRGEIKAIVINHGALAFTITRGMRIAQLVVAPVVRAEWDEVEDLEDTVRGKNGFGSTGV